MSLRTRVIGSSFVLAAGLLLLAAPAARAHEAPDGFYVEGGGGVEYWSLRSVHAIIDPSLNDVGDTDGTFWADTADLTIGFVDGKGTRFPDPVGRNARIEGHVRWAHGDSHKTVDTMNALGFFPINRPSDGPNGGSSGVNEAKYRTDLRSWEAELLYRTDVPFSDLLTFTPYAGIAYSHLEIRNHFKIIQNGSDISAFFSLDDDVEAHFGGLVLGGDAEFRPVDFLSFRAGVRADLMGVSAKLQADQNFSDSFLGVFFNSHNNHESDRDGAFAARLGAGLGVALHLGMFEIGVDGHARYLSYVPMADHPTSYQAHTSEVAGHAAWTGTAMGHLGIQF